VREFSVAEFAAHLLSVEIAGARAAQHGLEKAAKLIEADAQARIGHYQDESGPFAAWVPLSPVTEQEKARLGYPENAPLLRKGDLRASISHEVQGLEAVIGSTSDIAVYQELGTAAIPPRPFLGPAAFDNRERIGKILGEAVGMALAGQEIGYGGGGEFVSLT
jgi:HK97 gp10 family phage protein